MEKSCCAQLSRLIRKRESLTPMEQTEIAVSINKLVRENPRLALQEDSQGFLPLNEAIKNNLPLACIEILLDACPAETIVKMHYNHQQGQFDSPIRSANTPQVIEFLTERAVSYLHSTLQTDGWESVQYFFMFHSNIELVVRRLVEEFPGFLTKRWHFNRHRSRGHDDSEKMLALHCAVEQHAPINILRILVSSYPKALEVTTHWKKDTPLHLAIRVGYLDMNPDVLLLLSSAKSLRFYNDEGKIPLHSYLDCEGRPSLQVVQSMVELCPPSVRTAVKPNSGSTPLHLACNRSFAANLNLQVIQFLVDRYPRALVMRDSVGCTPLLGVCHFVPGEDVLPLIQLLVEASPESVRQLDSAGNTVVHRYLLGSGSPSLSIVEYLTSVYPGSLRIRDKVKKMTPIDIACQRSQVDIVRYLAQQYPETLKSHSPAGTQTPLHTVCSMFERSWSPFPDAPNGSESILALLSILSISEKVVLAKDSNGQTPLHLLSKAGAPREFLQIIVEKFPATTSAKDDNGRISLHAAIEYDCDASHNDTICYLLEAYPLGVHDMDNNDMTPLMLACERNACVSTIYKLVKVDPIASRGLEWSQVPRESPNVHSSFLSAIGRLLLGK